MRPLSARASVKHERVSGTMAGLQRDTSRPPRHQHNCCELLGTRSLEQKGMGRVLGGIKPTQSPPSRYLAKKLQPQHSVGPVLSALKKKAIFFNCVNHGLVSIRDFIQKHFKIVLAPHFLKSFHIGIGLSKVLQKRVCAQVVYAYGSGVNSVEGRSRQKKGT